MKITLHNATELPDGIAHPPLPVHHQAVTVMVPVRSLIAARLVAERERLSLTPLEVARATQADVQSVRAYESGAHAVPCEWLARAHSAGFDLHYLFTGRTGGRAA